MKETRYDKERKSDNRIIAVIVGFVIFLLVVAYCTSCNPAKQAYKGISKHAPETTKDSSRLTDRFTKTYKYLKKDTVKITGKTIVKTITKEDKKKILALSKVIDSVLEANVILEGMTINNDEYDSIVRSIKRQAINDAINKYCKPIETTIERVDTFLTIPPQTQAYISNLEFKLSNTRDELISNIAGSKIYKRQSGTKTYFLIGLCLLAVVLTYLLVKKK